MKRYFLRNILLWGAYYIVGTYSLLLAIPPGIAAPVWPAAGIALAGVLVWGHRVLPGVFLGAFSVNLTMAVDAGSNPLSMIALFTATGISLGAVVQAIVSSYLVQKFVRFPNTLEREKDTFNLIIRGGLVGCLISATCGIFVTYTAGFITGDEIPLRLFIWWVGDAIGVLIVTPLLMIISNPDVTTQRKITVSAPVLVILAISIGIFGISLRSEQEASQKAFQNLASHQADLIRSRVALFQGTLDSIKRFYGASQSVSSQEFSIFIKDAITRYEGIQALKWIPVVKDENRKSFEASVNSPNGKPFEIREKRDAGITRASTRPFYYPALYINPFDKNQAAHGFDLGSNPDSFKAIKRARDTGKQITTANVTLIQGGGQLRGFLVFDPIYDNKLASPTNAKERREALKGFALGVFRIQELVDGVLKGSDRGQFNLYIYDATPGNYQAPQYGAPTNHSSHTFQTPLRIGENRWILEFSPSSSFLDQQGGFNSWMFLIGGLLFASLLQIFLLSVTGRTDVVQRMVNKKSKELVDSESRHRAVVDNAADGLIVFGTDGLIESVNPATEKIFGYDDSEITGKSIELLIPQSIIDGQKKKLDLTHDFSTAEATGRHKNGSKFPVEVSVSLIRHETTTLFSAIIRDITDRKAAEDRLQKLSKSMQLILDHAGDGVYGIDKNGNTTFANKAALNLLGYSLEEMLHVPQHALIHHHYPDGSEYPREDSKICASLKEGKTYTEDKEVFWHKNGTAIPVEYTSSPIIDKNGIISGAVVVFKDISARKKAEEEKMEAARFNDLVMNHVPAIVVVKDEQERIIQGNKAFMELFPEEMRGNLLGSTLMEEFEPSLVEEVLENDRKAFEEGSSSLEVTVTLPNGQVRTFASRNTRFENSSGERFLLTFAQDITELRKKDEELTEVQYEREAYAEAADEGYWDWSFQDKRGFISPRSWELLGYDPEEQEQHLDEWRKVVVPEDLAAVDESFRKHVATKGKHPFHLEIRLKHKDGSIRYALHRGKVVEWGDDGSPLRMIGTQTDITDIKITEETLLKSNLELERFAYVASHDLQEPLRMISMFTELIKDEYGAVFDDTASRYMGFIYTAATRMQELVRDLLEYSRVDKDVAEFDEVECSPVLSSVLEALSEVIEESQAEITFDDLPVIHSSGIRISRLLQNLIGNGIKYRRKDVTPQIHVGAEEKEEEWVFSVADNGIGIKPEYLEQVFILFKRLHNQDDYSGTGIGLSICKKIAESLGGRIWADSKEGEGTTFYFTIPKKESGKEAA